MLPITFLSMSVPIIKAERLSKTFGSILAVDSINLDIKESEIFGLLGPNGAGKTTTIRLLTSMLKPTSGTASVDNLDIAKDGDIIRERVGLLTELPSLYERMTVKHNLEFYARIYGVKKEFIPQRIKTILELFDLKEKIDQTAGTLSRGQKQKVAIARSMIHDPDILFLDEPTASLAPESAKVVREQILKLAKKEKRTFFINSHNLAEVERLCTKVGILNKGKIVALDSPSNLRKILSSEEKVIKMGFVEWKKTIPALITDYAIELIDTCIEEKHVKFTIDTDETIPDIVEVLVNHSIKLREIVHQTPSLEEVYLELIEHDKKKEVL